MPENDRSKFFRWRIFTLFTLWFWGFNAQAQGDDPTATLNRMSEEIAGLTTFIVKGESYADARLDAGLIIEHASQVTMRVRKPDLVRIVNRSSDDVKEVFFSSNELTVYTKSRNFYGQAQIPGDAINAMDYAIDELGIDLPMVDFLSGDVARELTEDATDVLHMGTSLVRGDIYEHIVVRTPEIDVQLWVAAEGPALPGKMALSAKWDGGAPRTVIFMDWDTSPDVPDGDLKFTPPEGAVRIQFEADLDSGE